MVLVLQSLVSFDDADEFQHFFHECYVHDRIATGKFEHIQSLSSSLKKPGTSFGYQLTSWHLVVKPGLKEKAASFYEEDKIDFIDGHRVLRYFIVTSKLQNSFLEEKAIKHVSLLEKLPKHAETTPENIYKSITKAIHYKLHFITHTTPSTKNPFEET